MERHCPLWRLMYCGTPSAPTPSRQCWMSRASSISWAIPQPASHWMFTHTATLNLPNGPSDRSHRPCNHRVWARRHLTHGLHTTYTLCPWILGDLRRFINREQMQRIIYFFQIVLFSFDFTEKRYYSLYIIDILKTKSVRAACTKRRVRLKW